MRALLVFLLVAALWAGAQTQGPTNDTARWYTNGPILSRIPFDQLAEQGIWVFDTNQEATNRTTVPIDSAATLLGLIDGGEPPVLMAITRAMGLSNQTWGTNLTLWREALRKRLPGEGTAALQTSNATLIDRAAEGAVLLRRADTLETVPVTQGKRKERIIRLQGQVETLASGSVIKADNILINTDTRDLIAEGSVEITGRDMEMRGERLWVNLSNKQGAMFGVKGRLAGFFYDGVAFKLNPNDHYTLERIALTVESNQRPHFHLQIGELQNPRKNAYYASDITFRVHNAPFFWFPFLFQEPFGTGITLNAGQTTREGYFLQNSLGARLPLLGDTILRANFYEKIGSHFSILNSGSTPLQQYSLGAALAFTWDNRYIDYYANSLLNAAYTGDNLERNTRTRWKIDWTHALTLSDPVSTPGIQNRLTWRFYQTSDPYFTHNLERGLPSLDILGLLRNTTVEGRYVPEATDVRQVSFNYTLGAPGLSLGIGGRWGYENFQNWTYLDVYDTRHWENRLNSVVLPDITLRLSGAIDPPRANSTRKNFLNLGYSVGMGYRLQDFYVVNSNTFSHHDNLLTADAAVSWPLSLVKDFQGKDLEAFDLSFNPSVSANFQKKWGGEELGITYISNNLRDTRLSFSASAGFSLNFPANKVKQAWNAATNFKSMLPVAQFSANYLVAKEDPILGSQQDFTFIKYTSHQAQATFSASQRGYGLFYIPYLDLGHQVNFNAAYDFKPRTSPATGAELPFTWTQDRFLNFEGSYSSDLSFRNLLRLTYNVPLGVFDRSTLTLGSLRILSHNLSLSFNWSRDPRFKPHPLFQWESVNTSFNWQYQNQRSQWYQDNISFNLGTRFSFLKTWDFSLTLSALNKAPWVYMADKAASAGVSAVDIFADLADSLGFGGIDGLRRGHFKLTSVEAAITHDLDSWFLRLLYQLTPIPLANAGVVRGYYFDQRISFEINLKPEFRPPGFKEGFPPWKETIIPPVLRQQGRQ